MVHSVPAFLHEKARTLPAKPGVYLFHDSRNRILYIGKAGSLKARVAQYFDAARLDPAKREMMRLATRVDTIVTSNETEALALEASLIQKHEPPYNIRLVDDSSYLYVRVSRETYPRVELVRHVQDDGAWYRGPYPSATSIRRTVKEARKLFPWCEFSGQTLESRRRTATRSSPASGTRHPASDRACFAYHLGLCPGMCVRAVTVEEYQRNIEGLKRFLDGEVRDTLHALRARMNAASKAQQYEQAARARNAVTAIQRVTTPQNVVTPRRESIDAVGLAQRGTHAVAALLFVREGRVTSARPFPLLAPSEEETAELLRSFLLSYLPRSQNGSSEILLPQSVADLKALARVYHRTLVVPERGWKRRLLDLARVNAEEALARTTAELESPAALQAALRTLATTLHLERPPQRIEAYDVSHIQGTLATGSMVVFHDGKMKRSAYRKFKMVIAGKPDDYAMMREMLLRRFRRAQTDKTEWPLPDLVIVDGGKGQLNVGSAVLQEQKILVPIAALAKQEEELFLPGSRPQAVGSRDGSFRLVRLERTSPALFLLQRLRDEAHRFTLGYHQLLRKKRLTRSILDEIPGIGDVTRKKLLRAFGSLRAIRAAPEDALAETIGRSLAHHVKSFLS